HKSDKAQGEQVKKESLAESKDATHVVETGDILDEIAKENRTIVDKIVKDNQLKGKNIIKPSQKLVVSKQEAKGKNEVKALPNTGENEDIALFSTTVAGGVSIALGSLLLGRNRKTN
ncbi:TPA: LysM peptidoglycan-binding domain-containing protein, partial [Staphylococcus pseudintermedius]|nr:LysM peptidoglycan-binding domain-containing protein [Staphylococcus pseudintermedius]